MYYRAAKKLILLLVFFCSLYFMKGQDSLNSLNVESISYNLYLQKNWKELSKFGKKALAQGFDYFYLRLRIGIAYFETKDYLDAQKHFEKALQFNSSDELALEYLYFCFIYEERFEEARWLSKSFSPHLAKALKTDSVPAVAYVITESGIKTSDSTNKFKNGFYFHAGLGHYIKNRFSVFHALTFYKQTTFLGTNTQFQYYLRPNIPLKRNWLISPSIHVIGVDYEYPDAPKPVPPPPPPPGQPPPPQPQQPQKPANEQDAYVTASFLVRKAITKTDLTFCTSYSNMFGPPLIQHNLTANFTPFKTNILVVGCTGYVYTVNSYATTYVATYPFITINPSRKISISANYLLNDKGSNIVEADGYMVNNSVDLTTSRIGISAMFTLAKHLGIYALYQYENKYESVGHFNYHYHMALLGIRITTH